MVISEKNINIVGNLALSAIIALIYLSQSGTYYYDISLRMMTAIGLIPVISFAIMAFMTRDIRVAVITLVLYQTWNMFLQPYTWADPVMSLYRNFNSADFPDMALFCMMSLWTLYIGCIYGLMKIESKPMFDASYMDNIQIETLLRWMIIGGFTVSIAGAIISALGIPFGLFGLIDTMLPSTVGAVFMLYWLRGGRNVTYLIFVAIYMIYYFIYYVGGTLFIYCILLVVAPTIIYIIETKQIPYKTVAIVGILLLPIYISRHEYRRTGLYSSGMERMAIGMEIIANEYSDVSLAHWKEIREQENIDYNVDNRTEGVSYLGTVISSINSGKSSFVYGSTMIWLPTMFLPRLLIPFRPPQNMGDQWAVYYGLKDPSWNASINFPMLCEFYVNFGYFGMVVFMFFNGLLIVWMMKKFNNGDGDANLLLLIFCISKIMIVESNITLSYGAVFQVMTMCWLFKRFKGA